MWKGLDDMANSIISLFKGRCKNVFDPGPNLLVFPNIGEGDRAKIRMNFQLDQDEVILFASDSSFWSTRNQGLVLTDWGITCIPNKNKLDEILRFSWQAVDHVQYKELNIYFFDAEGNNVPIGISFFSFNNNEIVLASKGRSLAAAFTEMAKSVEPEQDPIEAAYEEYNRLLNNGREEEAFQLALDTYNIMGADSFCIQIARYYQGRDNMKAIEYCDRGIAASEVGSPLYNVLMSEKGDAYFLEENWFRARKCYFISAQFSTDEKYGGNKLLKDVAWENFQTVDKEYIDSFISLPYNERKILVPVKEYTDLSQGHVSIIMMDRLPSELDFPIGHPVANQVYVGHPYLPHKYIPFENYQLELVEDKVREFCQIAQCLGATEISIDTENSSQSNGTRNYMQDINGGVNYKGASVNGGRKRSGGRSLIEEISQAINLHQTFVPTKAPYLPKTTVWYQNEPSWQRLYEQRMNGGLSQHEERIETRKNQVVDNHELQEVKAELQSLFASANLNWNTTIEESFSQQENAVLSISVKFSPIESLANNNQAQIIPSSCITDDQVNTDAIMDIVNKNSAFLRSFTRDDNYCFFLLDKNSYSDIADEIKSILETFPLGKEEIPLYLCGYYLDENDENSESRWFLITNSSIYCDSYEELVFDWKEVVNITIESDVLCLYFERDGISYKWELSPEWIIGDPNAPMEQWRDVLLSFVEVYKSDVQEKKGNQTGITDLEQEYLDIVKDCIEDGEIGSRERKLLDKIRIKNGISEERAKELESTLNVPQLTEDETEYLEMYHEYAEKGEITEKERRRLDKFALALGLTQKRIEELESNF